jgi:hypothetical protein
LLEALEILLAQNINTITVDDKTALRMKEFYPEWSPDTAYPVGAKVRRNNTLWIVRQAHTSITGWEPENVPSLWQQIDETHSGEIEDPIPYAGNMALVSGSYYYQDGKLYRCFRDTGTAVYHALAELVGLYVEPIE